MLRKILLADIDQVDHLFIVISCIRCWMLILTAGIPGLFVCCLLMTSSWRKVGLFVDSRTSILLLLTRENPFRR